MPAEAHAAGTEGTALTLIFVALFVCLGLYPTVQRLKSHGFSRNGAVLTVLAAFVLVVALRSVPTCAAWPPRRGHPY